MKLIPIFKILLILVFPFLLFLAVSNWAVFDNSFYQQKFLEYGVQQDVPQAASLHEGIIGFIEGDANELPNAFSEREKQHLLDVRKIVGILTILLYALIVMFVVFLVASIFILKFNKFVLDFVGKVLVFGGFLTVLLAAILFFLISSDFSASFESFHRLLFTDGTYAFDPAKEMIVRLYPEQIFMDIGIAISKWAILASAVVILLGALLLLKSKSKKNKKISR